VYNYFNETKTLTGLEIVIERISIINLSNIVACRTCKRN